MKSLVALISPEALNATLVGNKAANLARLLQAGFNVPAGFVIPVTVFEEWVKSGNGEIPESYKAEIEIAFNQLDTKEVAVRSSATVEDGKIASWAGQFESVLSVTKEKLFAAIETCWRSSFNMRSKSYSDKLQSERPIAMAVFIQVMVPAEVAGVAFSIHPVTQNSKQIYIEAVRGLSEVLVSGGVAPTSFLVAKNALQLIGETEDYALLNNTDVTILAKIVKTIESYLNYPVDVEWALAYKKVFILQARAITFPQQ